MKFDEMRGNNPGSKDNDPNGYFFATPGHVRNICFVWPDGKMKFLNYAYLVSGECSPDMDSITLIFTSDMIILKGINLKKLFQELLDHIPKLITCIEERYNQIENRLEYVVNEIIIESN